MIPDKPTLDGLEERWSARWADAATYRFDPSAARERIYSIDTPPPTVSGSLHVGHAFSFTHTDLVARYRRMRGAEVFYPMGWDDNGLPTERRVQNYFNVRCDPSLAYQSDFRPPAEGDARSRDRPVSVSRPNFIELCERLTVSDEAVFEAVWRRIGLSVDWERTYTTIGERARRASQRSFLRLLRRGEAYQAEAPTLWDVDFRTAVAQAELDDRDVPGAYSRLRFHRPDGAAVEIDTTRPELLPACVALVAHPDDARYQPLFGSTVSTPLFGASVPVLAHHLAEPDKGTGIAMICTFGDVTDITWWRELNLPVRSIVGRDGRLVPSPPAGLSPSGRQTYEAELAGKTVRQAQKAVLDALSVSGDLVGEPRPVTHPVKFYERGDRPLEIVTSRQWFIRTIAHRQTLLARGVELRWHPPYMRSRYENWVEGLTGDWLISRQRFFGVPFPVWYPIDGNGSVEHASPILPDESVLPVDPTTEVPPGYSPDQRDQPGGFAADPDIMDTWATSSLTPQIACGWEEDKELFAKLFPMDLRPQAHDIIRTWLFATVVRSTLELNSLPWSDTVLSGWILDPDRKKMAKSKGNVVTPMDLLEKYGSDAVRYWAAGGRPGMDTAFEEGQMKVGRKLAIKLLNASMFVLGPRGLGLAEERSVEGAGGVGGVGAGAGAVVEPVDRALLRSLQQVVEEATAAFEGYDHTRALERTEAFFWEFCDNYLELVKRRAYGDLGPERARSAQATLTTALSVLLRLFAPFLPFVTEEVWSWWPAASGAGGTDWRSVHRSPWPTASELDADDGDPTVYRAASELLREIRRAKTDAGRSQRAGVAELTVRDVPDRLALLRAAEDDLSQAGTVAAWRWEPAGAAGADGERGDSGTGVQVVLAEE